MKMFKLKVQISISAAEGSNIKSTSQIIMCNPNCYNAKLEA